MSDTLVANVNNLDAEAKAAFADAAENKDYVEILTLAVENGLIGHLSRTTNIGKSTLRAFAANPNARHHRTPSKNQRTKLFNCALNFSS